MRFPIGKRFSSVSIQACSGFALFDVLLAGTLCVVLFLPMWFFVLNSRLAVMQGFHESTAIFACQSVLERFRANQTAASRLREAQWAFQEIAHVLPSGSLDFVCQQGVCTVVVSWLEHA